MSPWDGTKGRSKTKRFVRTTTTAVGEKEENGGGVWEVKGVKTRVVVLVVAAAAVLQQQHHHMQQQEQQQRRQQGGNLIRQCGPTTAGKPGSLTSGVIGTVQWWFSWRDSADAEVVVVVAPGPVLMTNAMWRASRPETSATTVILICLQRWRAQVTLGSDAFG